MSRRTILVVGLLALAWDGSGRASAPPADREEACRANNRGVALLEQFRHEDAAKAFARALTLDPRLAVARINLAIAFYNLPDLAAAEREAQAVLGVSADAPQPHFILGLIGRSQNRLEEAEAHFRRALDVDPQDVGALVNLGQIHMQQRRFAEAAASFHKAVDAEPYNTTAVYNLGLALTRGGQPDEGRRAMERFQALREAGYGTVLGQTYPDQGHFAEALASTGAEADVVDPKTPAVRFVDATAEALAPAAAEGEAPPGAPGALALFPAVLFDYDGDGDLDLFDVRARGQHLYRNDGGRMVDVTRDVGLDPAAGGTGGLAADFDTDGRPDLLVFGPRALRLYRNGEKGFADVTATSGIPADVSSVGAAAFADFDHDGDVDLFLGLRPGANRFFRNAGNGTFTDATAAAGFAAEASTVGLVPTDFDNRRDMDLLQVASGRAPRLFRNLRDGTFRDVATESKLPPTAAYAAVAAGDVNKDGFTDFFFGVAGAPDLLALSDGRTRFTASPAPAGSSGTTSAQFLDYDNDGLLDLVTFSPRGARILRNLGASWADVSAAALAEAAPAAGAVFASGDVDGDGDTDLVLRLPSGALRFWRNEGGERGHSLAVRLAGRVSNRNGVGAKLEMRAGSLQQKLETYAATPPPAPADVVFGLGRREQADTVRVLWPSGTLQTELVEAQPAPEATRSAARLRIEELDRKPSSCPYLYAWNGKRFEFITDFMGGGEMGYWEEPGVFNHPDPDEYVRLTDDQLKPRDGRYELRVTNELEEVLFADRFSLLAVAHPADVEVYPNEGMVSPMPPFRLYAVSRLHAPLSAVDDHGHDVLDRLLRADRRFPDDFRLHRIRGYAEQDALTLDLGPEADVLLLTGWTDYAFSSDNVAAQQAGLTMRPPELQLQDEHGEWRTVMPIGFPVGRPQTVLVDLAGKWLGPSRLVRIVTNMRIYWDQARAGVAVDDARLRPVALPPLRMDLRERGFSAEVAPDGRDPFSYDYQRVSWDSPWKLVPGRYTRPGDVRELLKATDDLFVISRPGDEIALSFGAASLAPLAKGWRRTFLLYADGFSKEMDINSATPDSLGPLPFHGMSRYPYAPPEAYPMTDARREVLERYTTRVVRSALPPLPAAPAARAAKASTSVKER